MSSQDSVLHIPCHVCMAVNRVPQAKLAARPKCGKCKAPVLPDSPVELDDRNFERFVSRSELPVVVDFWASWCGPCKMMAPIFSQVARQWAGRAIFVKVNTEQAPATSSRFAIRSIPSLLVFKGGRETARQAGAMGAPQLNQWLQWVL